MELAFDVQFSVEDVVEVRLPPVVCPPARPAGVCPPAPTPHTEQEVGLRSGKTEPRAHSHVGLKVETGLGSV